MAEDGDLSFVDKSQAQLPENQVTFAHSYEQPRRSQKLVIQLVEANSKLNEKKRANNQLTAANQHLQEQVSSLQEENQSWKRNLQRRKPIWKLLEDYSVEADQVRNETQNLQTQLDRVRADAQAKDEQLKQTADRASELELSLSQLG